MASFGKRLAELRKTKGFTQNQLAELVNVHVTQLSNYELEKSQPTLEIIRRLALALDVTADELVFDSSERMPMVTDKDLIKQWESLEQLSEEDRKVIKVLVESLVLRRQISRLHPASF